MTTLTPPFLESGQHPLRLLIVDDNPDVLHDLKILLELTGDIEIVGEGHNGQEAVGLASALLPDVLLMDLEMPVMDGYEATRQIKSQCISPRVIILSVHASSMERESAREAGADGFLVKGCSYERLREAILGKGEWSSSFEYPA